MELISVVIPVYNKEQYVEECLRNVLAQDYANLEVIAVDDGSTDRSGAICDEVARDDARLRVFHQANGGVTAARRYGVEQAGGACIAFVDSDDVLLPGALRKLHDAMLESGADEVAGIYCNQYGTLSPVMGPGLVNPDDLVSSILRNTNRFCLLWGVLYRKPLLDGCLDFPREIIEGEDKLMQMAVLMKQPKVVFIADCVYQYNVDVPNARRQTLDRVQEYDRQLQTVLAGRFETEFVIHQLKDYEDFLNRGQLEVRPYYQSLLKGRISSQVPVLDRIVFRLPPRLAAVLIRLYKRWQRYRHGRI